MGNGRSFSRNRKGSPGKSRRRARQRERAVQQFQASIQAATKSTIEATSEAVEEAVRKAAESLSAVSGISVEDAEDALQDVVNAFDRE